MSLILLSACNLRRRRGEERRGEERRGEERRGEERKGKERKGKERRGGRDGQRERREKGRGDVTQ